jgi:hypothetical protein
MPTTVASEFLRVAAARDVVIQGSVPAGSAGGGSANVTWQDLVPTIPGLLVELEYQISFSVTLTVPAAGSATLSPYAPYSAWANQLTLGGAPPWPLTELTPWWLDEITEYCNYDPIYPGLGNNAPPAGNNLDAGPSPASFGTVPGTVRGPGTYTDVFNFIARIRLQQKRSLLYGAIPMGDPENKIRNVTQLLPLVGNNPEQNMYVGIIGAVTATLTSAATVNAVYHVRYIDLLPSSDTKVPLPQIGYGVQLNANTSSIQNAGQQNKYYHRDSMAYLKIMSMLINNQVAQRASYFGLWDTQEQKSAKWEFDSQQNSFQAYFSQFKKTYRRYPPMGLYVADFVSGDFPEVPGVTPYNAIMSPDANYADAFDVAVTPAMTTTLSIPSGTAMNGGYQRVYSKGLVGVAY